MFLQSNPLQMQISKLYAVNPMEPWKVQTWHLTAAGKHLKALHSPPSFLKVLSVKAQ